MTGPRRASTIGVIIVIIGVVTFLLLTPRGPAGATHDPAITFYWPGHGWAAQAHSHGHDGSGPSNFPTWYGGTTSPAGYWYQGSPAGESACATGRASNLTAAASAVTSSTDNQPQLPDWSIGAYMTYVGCNVNVASRTLFTSWVNSTGGGTPGYTIHRQATSTQCASSGMSYPCGDWATVAEVQKSWWNSRDDTTRRKLLLHEWGHAFGMGDYCGSHPALSKNGLSPCLWPSGVQYYDLDDRALYLIYGQ